MTLEAVDFRFKHCLFHMSALTLQLPPVLKLTDEQFEQLAAANQDLQLELTAKGELIIMPPMAEEGEATEEESEAVNFAKELETRIRL